MTTARDWQAWVGDVWATEWRRTDRSFADLAHQLDAAILAVAPAGGIAADLGSGAGATSLTLAAAHPELRVHGLDLSPSLVAVATRRAAERGLHNAAFAVGTVPGALDDIAPLDLAVSRHGVMFFDDPQAAFRGIATRLRPGSPLVFSCFRAPAENAWAALPLAALGGTVDAPDGYVPGPFALADHDRIAALLGNAGFVDVTVAPADFSYRAGQGADPVADAIGYFGRIGPVARRLAQTDDAERPALYDRLRVILARQVRGNVLDFPAAAWIVTARTAGRATGRT